VPLVLCVRESDAGTAGKGQRSAPTKGHRVTATVEGVQ